MKNTILHALARLLCLAVTGLTVQILWNFFVAPAFETPNIQFGRALGLSLIVEYFRVICQLKTKKTCQQYSAHWWHFKVFAPFTASCIAITLGSLIILLLP